MNSGTRKTSQLAPATQQELAGIAAEHGTRRQPCRQPTPEAATDLDSENRRHKRSDGANALSTSRRKAVRPKRGQTAKGRKSYLAQSMPTDAALK